MLCCGKVTVMVEPAPGFMASGDSEKTRIPARLVAERSLPSHCGALVRFRKTQLNRVALVGAAVDDAEQLQPRFRRVSPQCRYRLRGRRSHE